MIEGFADIRRLLAQPPSGDEGAGGAARRREATLTKPAGSLGRLEEITAWIATWQGRYPPSLERIAVTVFAGNHGVAARGVSAYPAAVTAQMVANFQAGGAAINQLAHAAGATLAVVALDLDRPTADFTAAPAMTEAECCGAFARGFDTVADGTDLLCLGEMGIGNTTAAAALAHALFGGMPEDWVGRGTGVDDAGLARKAQAVAAAHARRGGRTLGPLEALADVGGRELAAIAGAVLAARLRRVPVLLDGFVCTAAAAVLARSCGLDHCRLGHVSAEAGHRRLAAALGLVPLLDLGMRLGEASGATLAALLVKAALATHAGMATFAEAGVSETSP
ncbi:MAG: nicotinate-nucleotide--dimethylbenzimidazole phosphoribosyltransferase [Alphaproteobacteria bacterium]|nr:nicotinate-nucleotide--dimethylbenzimidazole phosphoribosyltransferase [Alphaproteobacteria bacterium]